MIRMMEELSLGAWPAPGSVFHDGWLIRFAQGYTRRANSVQALYAGTMPLGQKIELCEKLYRDHGQRAVFKLTEAAQPAELDLALEARGYAREAQTAVMVHELPEPRSSDRVRCDREPTNDWLAAYAALNHLTENQHQALGRITRSIALPMCCACLTDQREPVACGMAVVQGEWVGLYDIVTLQARRRQGLASEVVAHLIDWARQQGAGKAYLQVALGNQPAVALYRKLGFRPIYEYWYRTRE